MGHRNLTDGLLDAILKFKPYESKPCSSLIVCIIQPLNIHKKSNLKRFYRVCRSYRS